MKEKNNKKPENEQTVENSIIPLKEEKNSENSEDPINEPSNENSKEKTDLIKEEKKEKVEVIESKVKENISPVKNFNQQNDSSKESIPEKISPVTISPEKDKPENIAQNQEKNNKKAINQNALSVEKSESPEENTVKDKDFIEVTKKVSKASLVKKDACKRFAPLASKPEYNQNKNSKNNYFNFRRETTNFDEKFKIEKDSRNKAFENKSSNKLNTSYYNKSKPVNLINTTELEEQSKCEKTQPIVKEPEEKEKKNVIKTEHGVTLCKKKDALEVLKAKIQRKEIEKQKNIVEKSSGEVNISNQKKIEIISLPEKKESFAKETILVREINDVTVKKEYKSLSHKIFWRKMENDINKFTENIATECKRIKAYRICVFDRIEFIVSNLFSKYNAHVKMYGSSATGSTIKILKIFY